MTKKKTYEYNPVTGNYSNYKPARTGMAVYQADEEDKVVLYGPQGQKLVKKKDKIPFGFRND